MSENIPREQAKMERRAEQTGTTPAGLERAPLHKRPGYRSVIEKMVESGLMSEEDAETRLDGSLHERIQSEPRAPERPAMTREQAAAENERAWNYMLGRREETEESDADEQGQLQFPIE